MSQAQARQRSGRAGASLCAAPCANPRLAAGCAQLLHHCMRAHTSSPGRRLPSPGQSRTVTNAIRAARLRCPRCRCGTCRVRPVADLQGLRPVIARAACFDHQRRPTPDRVGGGAQGGRPRAWHTASTRRPPSRAWRQRRSPRSNAATWPAWCCRFPPTISPAPPLSPAAHL